MKIKRYTAVTMRAALALVRAEQGPDAVILSSRRGEDGIEVIAAVDYDEALFADARRQRMAPINPMPPPASAAGPVAPIPPAAPIEPVEPVVSPAHKTVAANVARSTAPSTARPAA